MEKKQYMKPDAKTFVCSASDMMFNMSTPTVKTDDGDELIGGETGDPGDALAGETGIWDE